jgi:hypothetical protein
MAGAEKRRSTEPRNTVTMGVAATQDSTSDWRELGAQVSGFSAYIARIFESIPDNLLGLMVGDWLAHKRRRHLAILEANTEGILEGIAADRLTEPSPSVLIPLAASQRG